MSPTETLVRKTVENSIKEEQVENINKAISNKTDKEKKEGKLISYWNISRVDRAAVAAAKLYLKIEQEEKVIPFESIAKSKYKK